MAKITTTSNAALDLEPHGTGDINLTPGANGDVNIPANKGLTFASDTEKIESNDTDLTINSGGDIDLTATTDINIPQNVGLTFGADGEKVEGNGAKLDIAAANLDFSIEAGGDINIGTDIGLTFGAAGEKIEGDGTDLTVSSSGNFTVDATGDIILDAEGADITLKDGGTTFGTLKQVSGDLVIQPTTSKQIILNKDGGTAALTIDTSGNAEFPVSVKTDTISEKTADTGVTIDGAVVKDNAVTITGALTASHILTTGVSYSGVYYVDSGGNASYYTANIEASTYVTVAAGSAFSDGIYLVSAIIHNRHDGHALYTFCYNAESPGGQVGSIISSNVGIQYTGGNLEVQHTLSGSRYIRVVLQKLSYDV